MKQWICAKFLYHPYVITMVSHIHTAMKLLKKSSGMDTQVRKRSESLVEFLTQDRGFAGSYLTDLTALCP